MAINSLTDIIGTLNEISALPNIYYYTYEADGIVILDLFKLCNSTVINDQLRQNINELDMSCSYYLLEQDSVLIDKKVKDKMKIAGYTVNRLSPGHKIPGGYTHYINCGNFNVVFTY